MLFISPMLFDHATPLIQSSWIGVIYPTMCSSLRTPNFANIFYQYVCDMSIKTRARIIWIARYVVLSKIILSVDRRGFLDFISFVYLITFQQAVLDLDGSDHVVVHHCLVVHGPTPCLLLYLPVWFPCIIRIVVEQCTSIIVQESQLDLWVAWWDRSLWRVDVNYGLEQHCHYDIEPNNIFTYNIDSHNISPYTIVVDRDNSMTTQVCIPIDNIVITGITFVVSTES